MRTVSIKRASKRTGSKAIFGVDESSVNEVSRRLGETDQLRTMRQRAWKAVQQLPRPTAKDEAWRRTDPARYPYDEASAGPAEDWPMDAEIAKPLKEEPVGGWLINHPGKSGELYLDPALEEKGVILEDWASAVSGHSALLEAYLNTAVDVEKHWFAALASSMVQDGVVIYVPPGVQVEKPLRTVFWAPGAGRAFFSRVLVIVDEGASLELEQEYVSPTEPERSAFHAGVVEVIVKQGAHLVWSSVQNWGEHVWDVSHKRVRIGRDAQVQWNSAVFGGQTSKVFSDMDLAGEGAGGEWAGVFFGQGRQHFDIDTQQNHLSPRTTSDLLFKGALTARSRSVWQGMIYVEKDAQQTDGYQANRNLILSEDARADSIPGLEIKADDVRCTHGATAGQVDEDQVYYLMSRGIPRPEAEQLVVEGFFSPVLDRISNQALRYRLNHIIDDKMGQYRAEIQN